jgi:hypothetical protein
MAVDFNDVPFILYHIVLIFYGLYWTFTSVLADYSYLVECNKMTVYFAARYYVIFYSIQLSRSRSQPLC